jgi:hypothetical protein
LFIFQAGIKGITPLIIMGGSSLLGGFLAFLLPETLGSRLPETLEDVSKCLEPFCGKRWKIRLKEVNFIGVEIIISLLLPRKPKSKNR